MNDKQMRFFRGKVLALIDEISERRPMFVFPMQTIDSEWFRVYTPTDSSFDINNWVTIANGVH